MTSLVDLRPHRYVEEEFIVSGTARTYERTRRSARYATRVIVRRPADGQPFNGTVLAEWFNVTAQVDVDLDWALGYRYLLNERLAYVGISAQAAGVHALQVWDPARYGTLSHPGDQFSFDIYAQAVRAVRDGTLLGRQVPERVLASGHSQAGIRLHAFVERAQDETDVIDGFLLRGDDDRTFAVEEPSVPVLHYMSESEVVGVAGPASASFREDSANYRLWQVAGTSHNDTWGNNYWLLTQMPRDWLGLPVGWNEKRNGRYGEHAGPGLCDLRLSRTNQFPQRYSFAAALAHLERWVRGEGAPPPMPRLQLDATGKPVRDAYGNAVGGIRYPFVDVPVATYSGEGGCPLTGWTRPLDDATLRSLYPTHEHYVDAMTAAATAARDAGLLLDFDFADVVDRVAVAPVPRPGS
jgi:hypothetical protein